MSKFSNYLKGVVKEGKRVRWPKGADLWANVAVALRHSRRRYNGHFLGYHAHAVDRGVSTGGLAGSGK